MTLELVKLNEGYLLQAFGSKDRLYIKCLTDRCNYLLELIVAKTATEQEDLEHYALKWMLKQFTVTDKEHLIRLKK